MTRLSVSGNISLYPSLCEWKGGYLACAWYEYSSPVEPAPSDIWFSKTRDGKRWTRPLKVTDGISYNNGPSLVERTSGGFTIVWHSWRPPGKEPFISGHALANLWMADSEDGRKWTVPKMPFPGLSGSKYPSLAEDRLGRLWMVFEATGSERIRISCSKDGRNWEKPKPISGIEKGSRNPDLAIDWNGQFHLVYTLQEGSDRKIGYLVSLDGVSWEKKGKWPAVIKGQLLSRPKISIAGDGCPTVISHTESWGSYSIQHEFDLHGTRMDIGIDPECSAGNAFWTLNALEIKSQTGKVMRMLYGPGLSSSSGDEFHVTAESPLFGAGQSYGFNEPVRQMIRELGSEVTRSLVYSNKPRVFHINLKPGKYSLCAVYSSWIASVPGIRFKINGQIIQTATRPKHDQCYLMLIDDKGSIEPKSITPNHHCDNNRPSRLICLGSDKGCWLAWTSFAGKSVHVICERITERLLSN